MRNPARAEGRLRYGAPSLYTELYDAYHTVQRLCQLFNLNKNTFKTIRLLHARDLSVHGSPDATAVTCNLSTPSEDARHFGKGCPACFAELF